MYIAVITLFVPGVISTCYWSNKYAYEYFGSKTPYSAVGGDIRDVAPLPGCEPINVWFMMRHGTRHPGLQYIYNMKNVSMIREDIIASYAEGRGEMCAQDIANLKNWVWRESMEENSSALTEEGHQELYALGVKFQEKFHDLLENLDTYNFRPSTQQRTTASAKAFTEGLSFDDRTFDVTDGIEKDNVVRPYKYCEKRYREVLDGEEMQNQMNKFYETAEYKQMLQNIQKRTGLPQQFTPANLMGLYDLCRHYRAYSVTKRDAWCAVFSDEDLQVMEYLEDLRQYYRNGYGSPINVKFGEAVLKDLLENFVSNYNMTSKSITGYFTHDTLIEMIFCALGLFKDYPEINAIEMVKNRKWRISLNAPFAANFVAVLNRCNSVDEDESLKVQFFINEAEIHLCQDRACSWADFIEKFSSFADSNLEFCEDSN